MVDDYDDSEADSDMDDQSSIGDASHLVGDDDDDMGDAGEKMLLHIIPYFFNGEKSSLQELKKMQIDRDAFEAALQSEGEGDHWEIFKLKNEVGGLQTKFVSDKYPTVLKVKAGNATFFYARKEGITKNRVKMITSMVLQSMNIEETRAVRKKRKVTDEQENRMQGSDETTNKRATLSSQEEMTTTTGKKSMGASGYAIGQYEDNLFDNNVHDATFGLGWLHLS